MLEIGVRLGYSAYAFTCDNQMREYVGLDIQLPLDGGMPFKTFNWVRSKVVPKAPQTKFTFLECNTQEGIPSLGQFDLIHVDGDHSYEGALRDMNNCWPLLNHSGLMIVDDYSFIAGVKWACDAWAEMQDALLLIGPSKRGDALFWKT
jgi:predicted O-methyltransferase YrrM